MSKSIINNAVYGKTKENLRNRVDVKLIYNENDCLKWASRPRFVTLNIFGNNLVVIHKIKICLTLDKLCQVYIRTMYEFHEKTNCSKSRYLQLGV